MRRRRNTRRRLSSRPTHRPRIDVQTGAAANKTGEGIANQSCHIIQHLCLNTSMVAVGWLAHDAQHLLNNTYNNQQSTICSTAYTLYASQTSVNKIIHFNTARSTFHIGFTPHSSSTLNPHSTSSTYTFIIHWLVSMKYSIPMTEFQEG